MGRILAAVCGLAIVCAAGEARASFHLMQVVEVYGGAPSSPSAQYVVLQMYFGSQNFVGNTSVAVYSSANVELGRFTFPGSVPGNASQAKILIATTQAQTQFGVTADLLMNAVIPAAGGKVCFEAGVGSFIDCVAWGTHPGSVAGGGAGNVGPPLSPVLGLRPGRAAVRRLDVAGSPTVLESGDDTNHSANDWRIGLPAPRNNAGQNGTVPASTCGDSMVTGLESCDDGNAMGGDGCSATCLDEACGDAVMNDTSETCDDGNLVNGDGCDNTCRVTGCGSGVVTGTEQCDDGNLMSGDGCDSPTCRPTGCGSGVVTGTEQCDDGNLMSGDGCDANCTPTGCGNGIVTTGEDCEPPGQGGCDAQCQQGCVMNSDCADTDPCTTNERCDGNSQCQVDPTPIDDLEPCTTDSCGPGGVMHEELPDGMECTPLVGPPTPRAICVGGVCGASRCGDSFTDPQAPGGAETCDDGNDDDTDACPTSCETAMCNDGFVRAGVETCDDGNDDNTDACIDNCMAAACGDGFMQAGVEACDDANTVSGDGCSGACVLESCGDGVEQLGEECDDGNQVNGDGCTIGCRMEEPPTGEPGGCCGAAGAGGGAGAGGALVPAALVALLVLRRRRRPG
jgi:cysteine-rich repeat protein